MEATKEAKARAAREVDGEDDDAIEWTTRMRMRMKSEMANVGERRRKRASGGGRALPDDYEEESEEESGEEEEDDIEDVEIGSPKTGKMPKAKAKAKTKAKKEEPATAGVGDKSVEAAERYLEYDPVSKVTWKLGDATPYLYLANIFESIAETTKRLEIAELLDECVPDDFSE